MINMLAGMTVAFALSLSAVSSHAMEPDKAAEEQAPEEELARQIILVFVGLGTELERVEHDNETSLALALEYGYRLNPRWVVGGIIETLGGATVRDILALVVGSYHLTPELYLALGAGVENTETSTDFVVRLGVGYIFEVGDGYEIVPAFNLDLVERGRVTLVYGAAVGKSF
ncbi:MAG: hypothetical protein O7D32_06435 [bacterium]|nr:hypothetical protein [bacterium]